MSFGDYLEGSIELIAVAGAMAYAARHPGISLRTDTFKPYPYAILNGVESVPVSVR